MSEKSQLETVITIDRLGVIEIKTVYADGSCQSKNVSFDDLCDAIRSSVEKQSTVDVISSPVLPNNEQFGVKTLAYRNFSDGREQIVLLKKAHRCDVTYHTQKFEDVGIPNLIFAITMKDNKVRTVYVVATIDDDIKENTKLYHYPFSNASQNSGSICFGGNKIFDYEYESIHNLFGFPSMFLDMPNNDHMYGYNNSGMPYRTLLEKSSGVDFNKEYLKDMECTFKNWYDKKITGGVY